jgi:hypothetical protein
MTDLLNLIAIWTAADLAIVEGFATDECDDMPERLDAEIEAHEAVNAAIGHRVTVRAMSFVALAVS